MDVNYNMQSGMSIPLADIVESSDNYIKFANGTYMIWGKSYYCTTKRKQSVDVSNKKVFVYYDLNDDLFPGFKFSGLESYEYFNIAVNSISYSTSDDPSKYMYPVNTYYTLNNMPHFNDKTISSSFKSNNTSVVPINSNYSYDISFWFFAISRWK